MARDDFLPDSEIDPITGKLRATIQTGSTVISPLNRQLLYTKAEVDAKIRSSGGSSGGVQSVVAGAGIAVNATDPANPIVSATGAGTGDMLAATYDPNTIAADAFSMDNMEQGSIKKYVSASDATHLSNLSGVNTGDQDLSGLVPKTTTVNGHALSTNVTVSKSDVGLGSVVNADTTTTANITDSTNKRFVTDAQQTVIGNTSGTNTGDQTSVTGNAGTATKLATARNIDGQSFDGSADITVIAPGTHAATSKATPIDADELPLVDSAASNVLKKLTWANLKATAKTYFDTLYQPLSATLTSWAAKTVPTGTVVGTSDIQALTNKDLTSGTNSFPTFNQNTTGTAANVSGTPALPNGTTATTQGAADNSTKLATTAYTDLAVAAAVQGLSIKQSVQEATAAALPTNTYLAGVITITATGTLTVDGQVVALNDRVLVKNEATQANNGIYLCTTAGAVGVAAVLTRATDSNTGAKILGGFTFVETGTVNADSGFVNTNTGTITIGTTAITYTQFSGAGEITAGNGLSKSGNTLTIDTSITVDKTTAQALTNKDLTSGTNTFPTLNQNTTGSAAKWTTARNLAGNSVDGSANVAFANKFIAQGTSDAGLSSAQFLGSLGTGLVKNTTSTGVLSIATLGTDYGDASTNTATSVDGEIAVFNGTAGKTLRRATGTGIVKIISGVASLAASNTDYLPVAAPAMTGVGTADTIAWNINTVSVSTNAGTCSAAFRINKFTNSSAAAMTITLSTSGATDGRLTEVIIYDATAVAKGITWVNTENTTVTAPTTSNGSTTLPLRCIFQYNGSTSLWSCVTVV